MLHHSLLKCVMCGAQFKDDGLINEHGCPSLLRAQYERGRFRPGPESEGLFRFSQWMPIGRVLSGSTASVSYHSEGLAHELGLNNLVITFSGYWEEKSARMDTCTFKECEAYAVLARFPSDSGKTLVVASAGNTARAFIKVASENGIPLVVVIPKENLASLWVHKKADYVRVVATGDGSDYSDAIALAGNLCKYPGFVSEGGAKNVARRDGMGTVMLSAALLIGDAPDFYFQAVGSGTGAIAAWEANARLLESGFTRKIASLQLSQNAPFLPMYDAWKAGSRCLPQMDERVAKEQISEISGKVLSNRTPPYAICGGVYDALEATSGDMWAVTNAEIAAAQALFLKLEGRDICAEAGVAVASVIQAATAGRIKGRDVVMLNITGGGFDAAKARSSQVEPDAIVPLEDLSDRSEIEELAHQLIG